MCYDDGHWSVRAGVQGRVMGVFAFAGSLTVSAIKPLSCLSLPCIKTSQLSRLIGAHSDSDSDSEKRGVGSLPLITFHKLAVKKRHRSYAEYSLERRAASAASRKVVKQKEKSHA